MKEKPINFIPPMVKAILDGKKNQTRRVMNKQNSYWMSSVCYSDIYGCQWNSRNSKYLLDEKYDFECPYKIGELRLVKDPHSFCDLATIRITDLRAERVQSISSNDCIAEGIFETINGGFTFPGSGFIGLTPVDAFKWLWGGIYFKEGRRWDDNPWVWVVEFQVEK